MRAGGWGGREELKVVHRSRTLTPRSKVLAAIGEQSVHTAM